MSTAPCPDPNENNEELFKAVDKVFASTNSFFDEDGKEREFGHIDDDVIEREVARFRARLESAPSGVSPYEEG
jgi:flagellar motor switch protein FliM